MSLLNRSINVLNCVEVRHNVTPITPRPANLMAALFSHRNCTHWRRHPNYLNLIHLKSYVSIIGKLWSSICYIYSSCHYHVEKSNTFNTFHDVRQHLCDSCSSQLHIKKTHMPIIFYLVSNINVLSINHILHQVKMSASKYEISAPNKS